MKDTKKMPKSQSKIARYFSKLILVKFILSILITFIYMMNGQAPAYADDHISLQTMLDNSESFELEKQLSIFTGDVFTYYDLSGQYGTPLKKSIYKKSKEYQDYKTQLQTLKKETQKKVFYLQTGPHGRLSNYDIERNGFTCQVESEVDYTHINVIEGVLFKTLPITPHYAFTGPYGDKFYFQQFFIPANQDAGIRVESAKDSLVVYLFFPISQAGQVTKKLSSLGLPDEPEDVLMAPQVRVIVANEQSGEVFIDKTYKPAK